MLQIASHPRLELAAFVTEYAQPLADLTSPDWLLALMCSDANAPLRPDDAVRSAVRDLLRGDGFRPTGRSKPSSEYLLRAASEGGIAAVNVAVDVGNAVSLHSGLPVSVVDFGQLSPPLRVDVAARGARFVFNASGQEIDVGGLLCLHDRSGPCANAVKDAQRTKTGPGTRRTLSLVWGTRDLLGRTDATVEWYRGLVEKTRGTVQDVPS